MHSGMNRIGYLTNSVWFMLFIRGFWKTLFEPNIPEFLPKFVDNLNGLVSVLIF